MGLAIVFIKWSRSDLVHISLWQNPWLLLVSWFAQSECALSRAVLNDWTLSRIHENNFFYLLMFLSYIQIKLLKILALLGSGDKQASEQMYTILSDIFRKGESTSNIGNSILYQCICCVSSIYPNTKSLEAAADATSKFLKVCFATTCCCCPWKVQLNRNFMLLVVCLLPVSALILCLWYLLWTEWQP